MAAAAAGSCPGPKIAYPRARADETTSEYFGTIVKDPYRWMEDVASTETAAFVKEQVALTTSYFKSSGIAARSAEITKQLTAVWDYDRIYAPRRRGSAVFFSMKQGTRDQPVMMKAASPSTEDLKAATVFLDTAAEFPGQAMALSAIDFSKDGSMLAYGLSKGGSDWLQIRVRRCSDGVDLEDVVPWVRYSGIAWRKDGAGFFYNRYAAVPGVRLPSVRQPAEALPAYETESAAGIAAAPDMAAEDADAAVEAGTETAANKNQTVYYHELGADPRLDRVVFAPLDPDWIMGVAVSDCGNFVLVTPSDGCDPVNRVFVAEIGADSESWTAWLKGGDTALGAARATNPGAFLGFREGPTLRFRPLVDNFDAEYGYLSNDGSLFWFKTNLDAPSGRIISVRLPPIHASDEEWETAGRDVTECVGESPSGKGEVLEDACIAGGHTPRLVLRYLQDVVSTLRVFDLENVAAGYSTVSLPAPGTATRTSVDREATELFFGFESFVHAGSILSLDLANPDLATPGAVVSPGTVLHTEVPGHNPDDYVSVQEFFTSLDGTCVPMFLCYHKETALPARTLLYGYGGFSISLTPYFSAPRTVWMREMGGVFAMASLRGGAEYGERWHKAGALSNKHCSFEDFMAAAEYLHSSGRSSPALTAIQGGSNGGLLTLACSIQRPELFGAVLSQVPVTDMLRFHKFTIGAAWCSEFGNPDESEEAFRNLMTYSPLHNVTVKAEGEQQLPPTLICTADHDDRVVPSHTFKMLATLQAAAAKSSVQTNPLLGRIEVDAGHGAGKPLSKVIQEVADLYAFMEHELRAESSGTKA